jgi:hypothetical protein
MADAITGSTSAGGPSAQAGVQAGQRAKQAFEDWRQRMAAPSPFPPAGPPFGGFGMPPSFGFPPGVGVAPPATPSQTATSGSLFNSLSTMLRLAVDLINANLQGMLASSAPQGGGYGQGGGCGSGCGCGPECVDCCQHFGASCGGCHPSVNNCC